MKEISKQAIFFSLGTLCSRISGVVRDVAIAFCFGVDPAIASFMIAYRFSNLFRRLLGESSLSSGFAPQFESIKKKSEREALLFFRDMFYTLMFVLIGIVLLVMLLLYGALHFKMFSQDNEQICLLTMLMMPGLIFICLYALFSSLLQCEKKFFITGFSPVFFNLLWVFGAFLYRTALPKEAVIGLSVAVVLGFFVQWISLVPVALSRVKKHLSWKDLAQIDLWTPQVKAVGSAVFLGIVGISATQINTLCDALFAKAASLEGPAYLWYAIRVQQLPLALLGIALSSALLPSLSKTSCDKEFNATLSNTFSQTAYLMIPCSIALIVLGVSGLHLLYERGSFGPIATVETLYCLWGYAFGLIPSVWVFLLASACYARQEYRIPMKGAVYSMMINLVFNFIFIYGCHFGAVSVAYSTSISAVCNCIYLYKLSNRKSIINYKSFYKTLICACIAGGATLFVGSHLMGDPTWILLCGGNVESIPGKGIDSILQFVVLGGVFVLSFFGYAWALKDRGILNLIGVKCQ